MSQHCLFSNGMPDQKSVPRHVIEAIIAEEQRYRMELQRVEREHDQRLMIIENKGLMLSPEDLKEALISCNKK